MNHKPLCAILHTLCGNSSYTVHFVLFMVTSAPNLCCVCLASVVLCAVVFIKVADVSAPFAIDCEVFGAWLLGLASIAPTALSLCSKLLKQMLHKEQRAGVEVADHFGRPLHESCLSSTMNPKCKAA
jgi:hypothetical protein